MPHNEDDQGREERIEEILRPAPYLGYDRDSLARHLVAVGAFRIAESQFRRAVWLNPFEAKFKQHLAVCLQAQKRYAEAKEWIMQALQQQPDDKESRHILDAVEQNLASEKAGAIHEPGDTNA